MHWSVTICFIISWRGLLKDQEKRKNHLSVGSANTFEMREYYLRTASFKMAKFAKYFSIFPIIHFIPLTLYFIVSKIKFDNYTLYQNYFMVVILCLVAANGFFHAIIVHYSLLTEHFTVNMDGSTKTAPDFDLTSITIDKKANGDIFFFTGQHQISIKELSIAKIKS
ncbi:hypothetical protein HDV01_004292 [Terramyces sp. JEL0728]|nr:hypothetical protein HDV01_004292 [Terramyces sp. JEL0728]